MSCLFYLLGLAINLCLLQTPKFLFVRPHCAAAHVLGIRQQFRLRHPFLMSGEKQCYFSLPTLRSVYQIWGNLKGEGPVPTHSYREQCFIGPQHLFNTTNLGNGSSSFQFCIGLARKFVQVFLAHLIENPNELLGQPSKITNWSVLGLWRAIPHKHRSGEESELGSAGNGFRAKF